MVNWNSRDDTLACVGAVSKQLAGVGGATITVVDNGSTDGSIGAIKKQFPEVRLLPLGSNRGFTGGLAAALVRSAARNVIFLNNDALPEPGWLIALVDSMERASDDVVSVGGKIIDLSGEMIDFIGGVLTFDGHAFQNGFRYPAGSREEPPAGAEILFACGGNMISRREPLLARGGFDDDYFAYLEDVDFGWRTWISGGRVLFEPAAVVRHASSATSNRLGDFERGVLFERNALQTILKNAEELRDVAGAALFAYLHRLHRYTTMRNAGAGELSREPYTAAKKRRAGIFTRAKRRLFGREPLASIDDPLTTTQFRALDWIMRHADAIAGKRAVVQASRKRSDREIFERFPLHVVPTYPGDESLMRSPLFRELLPSLPSVAKTLSDIMRT
ncbi:MAG: glycosyltransferase [Acidobacteriota bacterium]